jgi:hypothetical protein
MGARLSLSGSLAFGAQRDKLDADLRTFALLGMPSVLPVHFFCLLALENGGRLAPMAAHFVDRLAILVTVRRFFSMGAAVINSRSLRLTLMSTCKISFVDPLVFPHDVFGGDSRREFMRRLFVALHGTLGFIFATLCMRATLMRWPAFLFLELRPVGFSSLFLFGWWFPLHFLVNIGLVYVIKDMYVCTIPDTRIHWNYFFDLFGTRD